MMHTCGHSNFFGNTVLIFLATLLFSGSAQAQSHDLQIMVSGPWSYVRDPQPEKDKHSNGLLGDSRIILIAPAAHHCAYVFSGPDATNWPSSVCHQLPGRLSANSSSDVALYYLDFPAIVQDHLMGEPSEEAPQLYAPSQVSQDTIKQVLNNPDPLHQRYAISLPMPDYISTYTGDYGSGFAESKVKVGHISYKTPRRDYTVWLVLHYSVNKSPTSLSLYLYDNASANSGLAVPVTLDENRSGISIVAFDGGMDSDTRCDKMSVDTFSQSAEIWGLQEHVRFPEELDDAGTQNKGFFHYDCAERSAASTAATEQKDTPGSGEPAAMAFHVNEIGKQGKTNENADRFTKSIAKLREDLDQAISGKSPADYRAHWEAAHDALLAYRGHIPKFAERVLSCTLAFMEHPKDKKSPFCQEITLLQEELAAAPVFGPRTPGSTDCHPGQISINNAFSEILN